jgi:hypothetical protein
MPRPPPQCQSSPSMPGSWGGDLLAALLPSTAPQWYSRLISEIHFEIFSINLVGNRMANRGDLEVLIDLYLLALPVLPLLWLWLVALARAFSSCSTMGLRRYGDCPAFLELLRLSTGPCAGCTPAFSFPGPLAGEFDLGDGYLFPDTAFIGDGARPLSQTKPSPAMAHGPCPSSGPTPSSRAATAPLRSSLTRGPPPPADPVSGSPSGSHSRHRYGRRGSPSASAPTSADAGRAWTTPRRPPSPSRSHRSLRRPSSRGRSRSCAWIWRTSGDKRCARPTAPSSRPTSSG